MVKTFSANVMNVFAQHDTTYDEFKNLMFDYVNGEEIVGSDGHVLSKRETNEKIMTVLYSVLGLEKGFSKRDLRRAMRDHGREFYDVIEEVIDLAVTKGFENSEFFNQFVEYKNIKRGDRQEFWSDKDALLAVTKVSGNHHDVSLQRLPEGSPITVPTSVYMCGVGADIDRLLTGQEDFSRLIDAVAKSYVQKVQGDIYAEVMKADSVPTALKSSGDLVKATFDQLLEDVSAANGNAAVKIFGTRSALAKITALADVNWATDGMKEDVSRFGRLGMYEGATLVEIPQRFAPDVDFGVAQANLARLMDNKKLLIIAGDDKFVKFVDVGETEIYEVTEKGKGSGRIDDIREYTCQREMGIATQIGAYHGLWTLS